MISKACVPTKSDGVEPWIHVRECHTKDKAKTHRGVVQYSTDVAVLNLVKWIDGLDTLVEQFMEDEADTSTTRQLGYRQVVRVSVDGGAEVGAEIGDDGENNTG